MALDELFEANEDEFLKFERIESPAHPAPDLCAFLMLHALAPKKNRGNDNVSNMVVAAEHDEIYLATDTDELAKVATLENIRDLVRCVVRYDRDSDSLCMFV